MSISLSNHFINKFKEALLGVIFLNAITERHLSF